MTKLLRLDLTDLYDELLVPTLNVKDRDAHSVIVELVNREIFLDDFAGVWRRRAEGLLQEVEQDNDE